MNITRYGYSKLNRLPEASDGEYVLHSDHLTHVQQLEAEARKLREAEYALLNLVGAISRVHDDARYQGVWVLAQVHIGPYRGQTYTEEFAKAKHALEELRLSRLASKEGGGK